nr:CoA transferase [uncultured Roseococcus sp.]
MNEAPSPPGRGFGTLAGLRVLDLTAVLMGPFCTQILADHGAEVIKVEGPEGDTTRQLPVSRAPGMGAMFFNLNRGKRGISLDLKRPEGRAALLRLAESADVFIHAMRADAMTRLGLTYADLRAVNPRIIYANMYGFSRRGPYAAWPAYDDTIQAMSGMAALQGRMNGAPAYSATLVADKVSGLTALYAVLMALLHRNRTGEGQEIEVGMFETMANFVLTDHVNGALFDPPEGEPVYPRAASPHRRPYRTKDGWIAVLIYNDKHWRAFVELTGQPEWARDPRFSTLKIAQGTSTRFISISPARWSSAALPNGSLNLPGPRFRRRR